MSQTTIPTLSLPLPVVPKSCRWCGERPSEWPLGVHGHRLNLTCPNCHTPVAALVAVTDNHEH